MNQDFERVSGLSAPPRLLAWSLPGQHLAVAEPQAAGTDQVSLLRFRAIGAEKTPVSIHERIRLAGVLGSVRHFLFTPDGQRLLVLTWDGQHNRQFEYRLPAEVIEPGPALGPVQPTPPLSESVLQPTGQLELPHQRPVAHVVLHPEGEGWLTVDEGGQIRIW